MIRRFIVAVVFLCCASSVLATDKVCTSGSDSFDQFTFYFTERIPDQKIEENPYIVYPNTWIHGIQGNIYCTLVYKSRSHDGAVCDVVLGSYFLNYGSGYGNCPQHGVFAQSTQANRSWNVNDVLGQNRILPGVCQIRLCGGADSGSPNGGFAVNVAGGDTFLWQPAKANIRIHSYYNGVPVAAALTYNYDPANPLTTAPWVVIQTTSSDYTFQNVFRTDTFLRAQYNGTSRIYNVGGHSDGESTRVFNLELATGGITEGSPEPPPPPSAPSGLSASPTGPTTAALAWTNGGGSRTGVQIQRMASGGSWSQIATVSASATSYNDSGLSPVTSYFYRVAAVGPGGVSGWSNTAQVVTANVPAPASPASPSSLAASSGAPTAVSLSWVDNANNEAGYHVERALGAGEFAQVANVAADATSWADSGLTPGTAYSYRVAAYNSGGSSGYSNTATVTTQPPLPPSAPSGLVATPAGSSSATLQWQDTSTSETGFKVQRRKYGDAVWVQIALTAANVTSYADTGLEAGTKYEYRVAATNAGGDSAWTATADLTTSGGSSGAPAADAPFWTAAFWKNLLVEAFVPSSVTVTRFQTVWGQLASWGPFGLSQSVMSSYGGVGSDSSILYSDPVNRAVPVAPIFTMDLRPAFIPLGQETPDWTVTLDLRPKLDALGGYSNYGGVGGSGSILGSIWSPIRTIMGLAVYVLCGWTLFSWVRPRLQI